MQGESKSFYRNAPWRRARTAALDRDRHMCRDCMDRFEAGYGIRPRRATMVHHVIPIEQRPDLALNLDNLRSLCDECHNRRHPEKGARSQEPVRRLPMRVIKV